MSRSQKGSRSTKSGDLYESHESEPADPEFPDHSTRRNLPIAPESVKTDRIPDPFVSEGTVENVGDAGVTYLKIQKSNWNGEMTSKYERQLHGTYPRILEADRHFQAEYDGVTTAMLTRRLSPIDDSGGWLTPWECNEMLHGGGVHKSVRRAIDYHLGDYRYEWVAVTAPTTSAGTPHEHIYLWVEDPADDLTTEHFAPALKKHLKYCQNAYEKHHQYRADGTDGAVTVQHDPDLFDRLPEGFFSISKHSQTRAETGIVYRNTRGAVYLATQLPHLHLGDYYNGQRDNPPQALFEGAAMSWISPHNWFRSSRGVPALDGGSGDCDER